MTPLLVPLPFDPTGAAPNNRTKGEVHDLAPQYDNPYRIIVMERGYFYTDNLYMLDNRGKTLREDTDYQCLLMNRDISEKYGKVACAVIVITNPNVADKVYVEAQMVGGIYCRLDRALLEQAGNVIKTANRKVYWKNLKDKPSSFRPNGHLHALWELFGFTEQTGIIHRMTTAIETIAAKDFQNLLDEWKIAIAPVGAELGVIEARLTTHITDQNDPHNITAAQLQLDKVFNAGIASQAQAQSASGTILNFYATPLRAAQSIAANFTPSLQSHVTNFNNPHQDTAAKLGTITVQELTILANKYYNKGATVDLTLGFMGQSLSTFYTNSRTAIPVANIKYGLIPFQNFIDSGSNENFVMVPNSSGGFSWRSIADIFNVYAKKGNTIIYAGTLPYTTTSATLTSILGTGHAVNTMAIMRYSTRYEIGTSNGSLWTPVSTIGMAVFNGSTWQSPGAAVGR